MYEVTKKDITELWFRYIEREGERALNKIMVLLCMIYNKIMILWEGHFGNKKGVNGRSK